MRLLSYFILLGSIAAAATPPVESWIPAYWPSNNPASLARLADSPINCLLIPQAQWANAFTTAAHDKKLVVLALMDPGDNAPGRAKQALDSGFDGLVLEGNFPLDDERAIRQSAGPRPVVSLGLRGRIPLGKDAPTIIGTYQGIWSGINPVEEGKHKAAPSGAPWIDTNAGFLRFVRASTNRPFWLSARPPANLVVTAVRYQQMISDAAMIGARWVVRLEDELFERLVAGESKALRDFKKINQLLTFFDTYREWQSYSSYGQLAIIGDVPQGSLLSGSVLDMITVKHTPVQPVPFDKLKAGTLNGAKMAVNVDPQALTPEQSEIVKNFTRAGGTVLTAPPGWKMPEPKPDQTNLDAKEVEKLDQIWKEVNAMTGRRNLGVRLFNVSSMLSNLVATPDGKKVIIYLTNYSDYPVDTISLHLLGKFSKATVYWPERKPKPLVPYDNDDGSGLDLEIVESAAIIVAEK